MVMSYAICFGNLYIQLIYSSRIRLYPVHKGRKFFFFPIPRCVSAQSYYDEITTNENDEQSKISSATIDVVTQIFTNFAKYG